MKTYTKTDSFPVAHVMLTLNDGNRLCFCVSERLSTPNPRTGIFPRTEI